MSMPARERPARAPAPRPTPVRLFLAFLRLGLTAFGGPAMIAHIRREAVEKRKWLSDEAFKSGVALCQTLPGATAMQTSAYVGLRAGGAKGAAASFAGFGSPAFALMLALSILYGRFHDAPALLSTFLTLDAFIVALIAHAAFGFGRSYLKSWRDFVVAPVAALLFWIGFSPILVVALSFALGALLRLGRADPGADRAYETGRFPVRPVLLIAGTAALGLIALFIVDRRLFELSLLMLRIDLFAFGGGFASVPLMLHEVVEVRHLMDSKSFMDGIALGQVTPGPIVITATFVGYAVLGVSGAVVATVSIFLPSFLLVLIVAPFFARLTSFRVFRDGMSGVLGSFVGLLVSTAIKLAVALPWDVARIVIAIAAFAALLLRVNLLWIAPGVIVLSLVLRL